MSQAESHNTEQLFDEISMFVSDCHSLLRQGMVLEMAGLDTRVQELCDLVLKLSQEERLRYADRLQILFDDIKKLGDAMLQERETLIKEIQGLGEHRKASVAYRSTDAIDNYGKKKSE